MRELDLAPDGKWAVGLDTRAYLRNEKVLPAADYYRVNTATGERTLIAKGQLTGRHVFGINPHGTHFLYWKNGNIMAYDLAAGTAKALGAGKVSFVDMEYDHPGTKPSYGVAGYAERREGGHRQPSLRPVARPARRLGAQEPHERGRGEERDPLPHPPRRAPGSDASPLGGRPRDLRPRQAPDAVRLRRMDEEIGLLRARRTGS